MAGGVTSLAILPDTDPALDEPGLVEMLTYRAMKPNRAHIYPVGALTIGLQGERLSEMADLVVRWLRRLRRPTCRWSTTPC